MQNEIEYLPGLKEIEKAWLEEMATYVKTVDPDTHVALGTLGSLGWGNIEDADIYTDHFYARASVKTYNSILHAGPAEGYFDFFLMHWNFDVNGDSRVDMKAVSLAASSFGSHPEHPRWNSHTDVNQDGRVDLKDITLILRRFGGTL